MKPRHPDPHDAARHRVPTYATARHIVAMLCAELPRTRSESSWLNLIEDDLLGFLISVTHRKPDAYQLAARIRRFSARLLAAMGLARQHDKNGRICRRGLKQARAVAVLSFIECRTLMLLSRHGAIDAETAKTTATLLHMWQGHRLAGLFASCDSDAPGYDEAYEPPTGVMGTSETNRYHVFNQQ